MLSNSSDAARPGARKPPSTPIPASSHAVTTATERRSPIPAQSRGPSDPPTEPKKRIVLADDHPIFLEGLKRLLQTEFDVVGTAPAGDKLVDVASACQPDLVVTDYSMPGMTGVEAVRALHEIGLECKVVMLTMYEDVEYALEALELGIDGYVLKRAASSELISAIKGAFQGERWISPALAVDIISASAGIPAAKATQATNPLEQISSRQRHILEGLVQGKIAKEIAGELELSRKTIEYHKYKMMEHLGVKSTAELIRLAVRSGMTT